MASAVRGRAAAAAVRARRRRLRDVPRHLLQDPLAGDPARLGGRAPPVLEKINLGKQAADSARRPCPSSWFRPTSSRSLARLRRLADRDLPRPPRHDARRAGRPLPAPGRVDPARRRAVHLGDPARLHRHHRPPRAGPARQRGLRPRRAGLPRRPRPQLDAAQLLRLRREEDIREGIRRIGEAVSEQVALYGTLTGEEGGGQRGQRTRARAPRWFGCPRRRSRRRAT